MRKYATPSADFVGIAYRLNESRNIQCYQIILFVVPAIVSIQMFTCPDHITSSMASTACMYVLNSRTSSLNSAMRLPARCSIEMNGYQIMCAYSAISLQLS